MCARGAVLRLELIHDSGQPPHLSQGEMGRDNSLRDPAAGAGERVLLQIFKHGLEL